MKVKAELYIDHKNDGGTVVDLRIRRTIEQVILQK